MRACCHVQHCCSEEGTNTFSLWEQGGETCQVTKDYIINVSNEWKIKMLFQKSFLQKVPDVKEGSVYVVAV